MNKDQVHGRYQDVKGKVKDAAGDATGDRSLQGKGKLDKAAGKVQGAFGDAKEKLKGRDDRM